MERLRSFARAFTPDSGGALAIWCSCAVVSLAALLIIPLLFNVLKSSPLSTNVSYGLEFLISVSCGMISISATEIIRLRIPLRVSTIVLRVVEVLVGSAAFALTFAIGPEEKMTNAADWVFARQLEDCRSAAISVPPSADAEGRCLALKDRFPNRPEPLELLGKYTYRTASLDPVRLKIALDYYTQALKLYDLNLNASEVNWTGEYSVQQLSTLREVVRGVGVTTAESALREFGVGTGSKESALRGLFEAQRYFSIGVGLSEFSGGSDYRIAMLVFPALIDMYVWYLLSEVSNERLEDVKQRLLTARNVPSGKSGWLDFSIFFVAARQAYEFANDEAKDEAVHTMKQFIRFVPNAMEDPVDALYSQNIRAWLKAIVKNEREELFVITRPIGSKEIGGKSMKKFFDEHPEIRNGMLQIVDS